MTVDFSSNIHLASFNFYNRYDNDQRVSAYLGLSGCFGEYYVTNGFHHTKVPVVLFICLFLASNRL